MGKRKFYNSTKDSQEVVTSKTSTDGDRDVSDIKQMKLGESSHQGDALPSDVSQAQLSDAQSSLSSGIRPGQLRTSVRVQNKQKKEVQSDDVSLYQKQSSSCAKEDDIVGIEKGNKKRRRAWEVWSMEDKDIFFESINECGKDFDAMQNYIMTKLKKKGTPSYQIKNRDQVRHFYYRTWHKISKHIYFREGVKKSTQELYALINFGELRKKIKGSLDEKKAQRLQDLIQKGSTSVRIKGKTIRIKTPICRALKKLNEFEDHRDQSEQRIPTSVMLEVVPANMKAWDYIQSLAHNPRISILSPMYRPLSSVLFYLEKKWKHAQLKLREYLASQANFCVEMTPLKTPALRVAPPKNCTIRVLNVELGNLVKSSSVSFSSHEAWLKRHLNTTLDQGQGKKLATKGPPEGTYERDMCFEGVNSELSQDETEGSDTEVEFLEAVSPPSTLEDPVCSIKQEPSDADLPTCAGPVKLQVEVKEEGENGSSSAVRKLLALEAVATEQPADDDDVVCIGETTSLGSKVDSMRQNSTIAASTADISGETGEVSPHEEITATTDSGVASLLGSEGQESLQDKIKAVKGGWSLKNAGSITIGELYLMFGHNNKVALEYDFEEDVDTIDGVKNDSKVSEDKAESQAEAPNNAGTDGELVLPDGDSEALGSEEKTKMVENLSCMLSQLLSMSKMMYQSHMAQTDICLCGQSCKTLSGFKSPSAGKFTLSVGKSPGNTRSPRNAKSPRLWGASGRGGFPSSRGCDRGKPISAKRLLPDIPEYAQSSFETRGGPASDSLGATPLDGCEDQVLDHKENDTFLVPTSPALRPPSNVQNNSFNAQLNKLLPRLNTRSCRRQARNNVIVQRQLPLLPKKVNVPHGMITLKVLPNTAALQNQLVEVPKNQVINVAIPPVMGSTAIVTPCFSSQTPNVPTTTISTVQMVSSSVLLSVSEPSLEPKAEENAISVKISGQPLLTVNLPSVSTCIVPTDTTTTVTSRVAFSSALSSNLSLAKEVTFDDLTDLSTPPSTPAPTVSSISLLTNFPKHISIDTTSSKGNADTLQPVSKLSSLLGESNSTVASPSNLNLAMIGSVSESSEMVPSSHLPDLGGTQISTPALSPEIHIPDSCAVLPSLSHDIDETTSFVNDVQDDASLSSVKMLPFSENSTDKFFDLTLNNSNSNSCFTTLLSGAASYFPNESSENSLLQTPTRPVSTSSGGHVVTFPALTVSCPISPTPCTSPASPSRHLQQSDTHWLNNEVNDLSFSNLFGSLESPSKATFSTSFPSVLSKECKLSSGPSLLSILGESSVDFTARFAEMQEKQQASQDALKK